MDVHQRQITFAVLDSKGDDSMSGQIDATEDAVVALLESMPRPLHVAFEAGGSTFWLYDVLCEQLGAEFVHVAQPKKIRAAGSGNTFNVLIEIKWVESDEFQPCNLHWIEKSNVVVRRYGTRTYLKDVDKYDAARRSQWGINSPTVVPWARIMDIEKVAVDSEGHALTAKTRQQEHKRLGEELQSRRAGQSETIPLRDSPCYDGSVGDFKTGIPTRDISGAIQVDAGCTGSACSKRTVIAYWAQHVSLDSNGDPKQLWFSKYPPFRPTPRHRIPPSASWLGPTGATGWENRLHRAWKQLMRRYQK